MEQSKNIKRPVIYVFINKSLGMSSGKIAAQASHATALALCYSSQQERTLWANSIHRTMIVLEAKDTEHLERIKQYLDERGFYSYKQIDEGVNEIEPHSLTAMASAVLDKDDEDVFAAYSTFKLYKDVIKFNVEIDR